MNETTNDTASNNAAAAPPATQPGMATSPPPAAAAQATASTPASGSIPPVTNAKAAESLSVGRMVHFVMPLHHARNPGAHRPAVCVAVNSPSNGNFQVFTDGSHDGEPNQLHKTSISQGSQKSDGTWPDQTWHWPERT